MRVPICTETLESEKNVVTIRLKFIKAMLKKKVQKKKGRNYSSWMMSFAM